MNGMNDLFIYGVMGFGFLIFCRYIYIRDQRKTEEVE